VTCAVLLGAVALGVVMRDGADDGDASGDSAAEATGADTAGADTVAGATPVVPMDPVQGATDAELCAATVERLLVYRDAAADSPVPPLLMIDQLAELEGQVDVRASDRAWVDPMIEDLTGVRREWTTARSAASEGDDAAAEERGQFALDLLDAAIARSACPTA